jgi:predicted  nucleic acid-binding Zn-ribbon protein
MGKITSVNLDEQAVEYFQRENINVSAWIRDIMEQRMTSGKQIDITQMRITELEREREDHQRAIDRIDEQLQDLREEADAQQQITEAEQSFSTEIITLNKEFQAFATADKMRSSQAFRRRASECDLSVFEAADMIMQYREAIKHE